MRAVKCKGYGDTIKYGLDNAVGDILVVVEADHTFRAKDLGKFLEYLKDSDMVIGTRTTRQMIEQGANVQVLLRWGNVFVGKLVEALWWASGAAVYRRWMHIQGNLEGSISKDTRQSEKR